MPDSVASVCRSGNRRALRAMGFLVTLTVATLVAAAVLVVAVLPRVVSGEAMTVITGSMEPAIPTGSLALVRPVDPQTVEVGDVLTYQVREGEEVFITHRLIEVTERGGETRYVLQGDANNVADDPILGDRIRGEVWFHVPYLGAIRDGLNGRGGVYLIGSLLLAWFAISQISGGLRERREQRDGSRTSSAAPDVTLDRPVVVARFTVADLDGGPDLLAAEHGGLVLTRHDDSCQLLFVVEPEEIDALADRLRLAHPLSLHVAEAGTRMDLPGSTAHRTGPRTADLAG